MNDLLPKRANEDYLRHNSRGFFFFVEAMSACMVFAAFFCTPMPVFSITLDEAIKRALAVSYTVKEQKEVIKRTEYSYISTIDPYLPRVDIKSSYIWSLNGQTSVSQLSSGIPIVGGVVDTSASRNIFTYTGSITLRLFDGGERYSKRKGAYSLLEKEQERLKGMRVDVLYFVKTTFYIALGNKAIVETRKDAYRTAEKVYALTKGRYDEGVAKKSEVLQAEVRMTTTKIEYYDAIKEYEKALEEFKSLLLYNPLDAQDVEGPLLEPKYSGDFQTLIEKAIKIRPDVTAQMKEVERLNMAYKERRSLWFPRIDAQL